MQHLAIHQKMRDKLPNELCDKIYSYLGMNDTAKMIKYINYADEANKLYLRRYKYYFKEYMKSIKNGLISISLTDFLHCDLRKCSCFGCFDYYLTLNPKPFLVL
jgi:hypothetical protein